MQLSYLVKVEPTTPKRPLQSIFFFKPHGDKKIQDWTEAREAQSQTKSQTELFTFEPESCDTVLHNWYHKKHCSRIVLERVHFLGGAGGKVTLPSRDSQPSPKNSRPTSMSGSRTGVPWKWEPSANSAEPKTQRRENTHIPTAMRKDKAKNPS